MPQAQILALETTDLEKSPEADLEARVDTCEHTAVSLAPHYHTCPQFGCSGGISAALRTGDG